MSRHTKAGRCSHCDGLAVWIASEAFERFAAESRVARLRVSFPRWRALMEDE